MDYLTRAIINLRAGSEFAIQGDNYSTIVWHKLEGVAPTEQEIETEIARIKIADNKNEKDRAAAKAALLERLGITADEAALLLS
jgi:predicted FMN-binding regulatory protein PaiB